MRFPGKEWTGPAVVLVLMLLASLAGCLGDDDDNGNGGDGGEVLANAGPDVVGEVGVPVTLNGTQSSGDIVKYWWDVDRGNASEPLTEDVVGSEVEYTYSAPGVYTVTLTVEGKKGKTSNDTLVARIDLFETINGTLSITQLNQSIQRSVETGVQKLVFTLTYPTTIGDIVPKVVLLDVDVYAGDARVASSTGQLPDQASTQTETLDVPLPDIIDEGGFRVVVRWEAPPVGQVAYGLEVEAYYHTT
jgi:hypothetical protein